MHWGSHLGHSSIPLMGNFQRIAALVLSALLVSAFHALVDVPAGAAYVTN